jgi:hypothetical protein
MALPRPFTASLLALGLAACGDDGEPADGTGGASASSTGSTSVTGSTTTASSGQGTGGEGQGGEAGGGQGGAGGDASGGGGSGGTELVAPAIDLAFRNQSHGESWAIVATELDGDADGEIVLGGRGLAAFDVSGFATNTAIWTVDWDLDGFSTLGGDNDWAYAAVALAIDGDDVPDLVVSTSFLELIAFSGADGSVLWRTTLEGNFPTALALFDGDEDGVRDVFAVSDARGFSGATGEPLWTADVPDIMVFALSAELDGQDGGELYVGIENDVIIGPGSGGGVILPTLYGLRGDGEIAFSYEAGERLSALAAADLDGDGRDEAIAASGFAVDVVGPDGDFLWGVTMPEGAHATEVAAGVVDGAPRLYVGVRDFELGHRIDAYDASGTLLWSHALDKQDGQPLRMEVTSVAGRDVPVLLVGTGGEFSPPQGAMVALDLDDAAATRVVWHSAPELAVDAWAHVDIDGEDALVFGGQSTVVHAVRPGDGERLFDYTSGSFVFQVATGDLDGDGASEVVTVDDHANVRCVGSDGVERWTARLDVGGAGTATGVAIADLDGDGAMEVVAGGWTYDFADERGVVNVFSGVGEPLAALRTAAFVESVAAGDLDGDGAAEIVATEASATCTVHAWDGQTFAPRFSTPIAPCFSAFVSLGDLDGEPGAEIAYADVQLFGDAHVSLVDGAGEEQWTVTLPEIETWVAIDGGRFLVAGAASEFRGHVTERAADDGSVVWQTYFPGRPDPLQEGVTVTGAVRAATFLPDRDGDDVGDLALGLATAELAIVSGDGGDVMWTVELEDPELEPIDRHVVGAIAYVPVQGDVDEALVVGMGADGRSKASLLAVDLEGSITSAIPTLGEVHDVALAETTSGEARACFAAGLDLWAVDVVAAE